MDVKLTRRGLFRGVLGLSALQVFPSLPPVMAATEETASIVKPPLRGSSQLTEAALAVMDGIGRERATSVLRCLRSFAIAADENSEDLTE